jgi:hypothetical protein
VVTPYEVYRTSQLLADASQVLRTSTFGYQ